jgi:hypothetical protein
MLSCFPIHNKTKKNSNNSNEKQFLLKSELENNKLKLKIYKNLFTETTDIYNTQILNRMNGLIINNINKLTSMNHKIIKKREQITSKFEIRNSKIESLSDKLFILRNKYKANENNLVAIDTQIDKFKIKENIEIDKITKSQMLLDSLFYKEVTKLRKDHSEQLRQTNGMMNNSKKNEIQINEINEEIHYLKNPKLRKRDSDKSNDKLSALKEELNICKANINVLSSECEEYRIKNEMIENESKQLDFELKNKLEFIKYLENKVQSIS